MASFHPRGLIGRIYVGDHWTCSIYKIKPHGFREHIFMFFFHYKSMRDIDPQGVPVLILEGLYGGVWYSLFIKNLAHYSSH